MLAAVSRRQTSDTNNKILRSNIMVFGSMMLSDYYIMQDAAYNNAEYLMSAVNTMTGKGGGKLKEFDMEKTLEMVDDVIYNKDKDIDEKVSKLYVLRGNKPISVTELHAGDIGAIPKLTAARTGNTLSTKANIIEYGKGVEANETEAVSYNQIEELMNNE